VYSGDISKEKEVNTMPAIQEQTNFITIEQYEYLPEDKRVEVFDGVPYDMASPSEIHQTLLTELLLVIGNYIKSKKGSCRLYPAPFDVKLNDDPLTIVQPDLMIVCDKSKLDGKRVNGATDFIIEIVSPNYTMIYILILPRFLLHWSKISWLFC
jgi:Uma2 family endonuclease